VSRNAAYKLLAYIYFQESDLTLGHLQARWPDALMENSSYRRNLDYGSKALLSNDPKLSRTIFTLGHGNLPADQYLGLLHQFNLECVVDVRSYPYSRYVPQFNRESLEAFLRRNGIDYRFAGQHLGGRPTDPACYKSKQVPEGPRPNYLELVDYRAVSETEPYQIGIQRLVELALVSKVAITCSEEDPARCHRHHLIAGTLMAHGWEVLHIRRDGSVVTASALPLNTRSVSETEARVEQLSLL
jgi:hypothetical protein